MSSTPTSEILVSPPVSTWNKILPVKIFQTFLLILLATSALQARETVEIAPIVVTGTFELRRAPTAADSFTLYLERQIETKRAEEEAIARSPIWNARLWSFIPIRLESSINVNQFFVPNYLTPEYREAAPAIDDLSHHSLFDPAPKTRN